MLIAHITNGKEAKILCINIKKLLIIVKKKVLQMQKKRTYTNQPSASGRKFIIITRGSRNATHGKIVV